MWNYYPKLHRMVVKKLGQVLLYAVKEAPRKGTATRKGRGMALPGYGGISIQPCKYVKSSRASRPIIWRSSRMSGAVGGGFG